MEGGPAGYVAPVAEEGSGTGAASEPWRPTAPAIFALIDAIEVQARQSIDPAVAAPVRAAVAAILVPAAERAAVLGRSEAQVVAGSERATAACVAFAEQFVVDVAGTTDEQRRAMTEAMGADAFPFVQALYVTDVFLRLRIGLGRLFVVPIPTGVGLDEASDGSEPRDGDDLWTLLERFMAQVARLDALDPLTSELVRLQGARVHDCRLCRSRRSVRALDAAGDASLLDAVARDGGTGDGLSTLAERPRVALRLTDALVTQPASIDAALVAEVHGRFTTDQVVELVLDVARNAANKIAVAFAADAPVVTDGVEFYDLDATGEVVADADIDAVRRATAR